MPFEEPIRIISDLHFGHSGSLLADPAQLEPLFRGAKTVVFNGDTVEMRFLEDRSQAFQNMELVGEVCLAAGARPVFVNGNHDPIISALNHLDLANDGLLVTHGDMLFHDISPWSKEARVIGPAHTRALQELGEHAFHDFEKRLNASKRAALSVELHKSRLPRGPLATVETLARECWPPWRPLQILRVWAVTPARAVALARVFRPRARFIAIGHTHFGGTWRLKPRIVINTGSFLPFSVRRALELEGNVLTVYNIALKRNRFELGKRIARYKVTKLEAHEGF